MNISDELTKIKNNVLSISGFEVVDGDLEWCGNAVPTISVKRALKEFLRYLENLNRPVILAGHNAHNFHGPLLVNTLNYYDMNSDFEDVVYGIMDTMEVMKRNPMNAKYNGKYNIWDLCRYHRVGFNPGMKSAEDKLKAIEGLMDSLRLRCRRNGLRNFHSALEDYTREFPMF